MALSHDLISQFAKVVNQSSKTDEGTVIYGKVVVDEKNAKYVQPDGSDQWIPLDSTYADVKADERVSVLIKNHIATVTGNITSPSASSKDLGAFEDTMSYETTADDITLINANIETLETLFAKAGELEAYKANIENLKAKFAEVSYLSAIDMKAITADFEILTAATAEIENLGVTDLEVLNASVDAIKGRIAEFDYVSTNTLKAVKASIEELDAKKINADLIIADKSVVDELIANKIDVLSLIVDKATIDKLLAKEITVESIVANKANIDFANIDFANIDKGKFGELFAQAGIIQDYVSENGVVTGKLVAVSIDADNITAGSLLAERIMLQGDDGLFYKLNIDAMGQTTAEQLPEDEQAKLKEGIHGKSIIAESITADKIKVSDLHAFGATIGGFVIDENAIYSYAKESVDSGISGVYQDKLGQFAVGNSTNFVKFYIDGDKYKLDISADSIRFGTDKKSVQDVINDIQIGGRNLIRNSETLVYKDYEFDTTTGGGSRTTLSVVGPDGKSSACARFTINQSNTNFVLSDVMVEDTEYTLSFWAKRVGQNSLILYIDTEPFIIDGTWQKCVYTFTANSTDLVFTFQDIGQYDICRVQLETGNKASDWTPAPEDVIEQTEAMIDIKSDSITQTVKREVISDIHIGGRNLIRDSETLDYEGYVFSDGYFNIDESGTSVTFDAPENVSLESVISHIENTDEGVNSLTLRQVGKNLLRPGTSYATKTQSGVTFTVNDDNSFDIKTTASGATSAPSLYVMSSQSVKELGIVENTTYTLTIGQTLPTGVQLFVYCYDSDGNGVGNYTISSGRDYCDLDFSGVDTMSIRFYVIKGTIITDSITFYPMLIEFGADMDIYEPCQCIEKTVELDIPVRGGSFDWVTGVLINEVGQEQRLTPQEVRTLSGSNTFYSSSGNTTITSTTSPANSSTVEGPDGKEVTCARVVIKKDSTTFTLHGITSEGADYTLSFWAKSDGDYDLNVSNHDVFRITEEWEKHTVTFTADSADLIFEFMDAGAYYLYHTQLETGNQATDWAPAPEDFDSDIADAQDSADEARKKITSAESAIKQLADSISMLVRSDGQNSSVFKQEANGMWYINIDSFDQFVNDTSSDLNDLDGLVRDADGKIDVLQSTAEALQARTEYVRSYTDANGQPCLELGDNNPNNNTGETGNFKVRITNTDIQFDEDGSIPARINRKMLIIEKTIVKGELQFGDDQDTGVAGVWIWSRRQNGNLGLVWKE